MTTGCAPLVRPSCREASQARHSKPVVRLCLWVSQRPICQRTRKDKCSGNPVFIISDDEATGTSARCKSNDLEMRDLLVWG
jgi:hypothetical protein